jgi:hypothetical protein
MVYMDAELVGREGMYRLKGNVGGNVGFKRTVRKQLGQVPSSEFRVPRMALSMHGSRKCACGYIGAVYCGRGCSVDPRYDIYKLTNI